MLKMLLDPMGGIVLTNDGHAILREIEVAHPAAKSMIELSRTQDEEVGDGTTTVIILGTDKAISLVDRQADWKQRVRSLRKRFPNSSETYIQLSSSPLSSVLSQMLLTSLRKYPDQSISTTTRTCMK